MEASELKELRVLTEQMSTSYTEFKNRLETQENELKKLGTRDVLLEDVKQKAAADFSSKFEEFQTKLDAINTRLNRAPMTEIQEKQNEKLVADLINIKHMAASRKGGASRDAKYEATLEEAALFKSAYQKYIRSDIQSLTSEEHKALSVSSDTDGGYLVRPEYSNNIIERIYETSPMRQVCNIETISTQELRIPMDIAEADAGWVGEQATRSVTNTPTLNEKGITCHELYALPKVTQQLLEDAMVDVEAWLARKVSEKMGRLQNTAFVSGNGVGKPRGITTYAAGSQGTTGAVAKSTGLNAWGEIEQIKSGTNGQWAADMLIDMVGSMKEDYHPGASFMLKRTSLPAIMQLKETGTGAYLFQFVLNQGFMNAGLLGYPVRFANDLGSTGTTGALAIIFANFKRAYTIVDRLGISVLRDPFVYKPFIAYYTRMRVGGDVTDFDAVKIGVLSA